jgi:hypothetical protein
VCWEWQAAGIGLKDLLCYSARVTSFSGTTADQQRAGLCAGCIHARRIESDRGSVFFLCQLALTDSRFPKYPRLPVLSCPGYEKIESGEKEG